MADLRKRRAWLIAVTVVGFIAISLAGGIIGTALGWDAFVSSAITAVFAVAFATTMADRIKKLK